jgi:hypothetical protein
MGTPASIKVYNEKDQCLVNIYSHWDGYPDGMGIDIYEYLNSREFVNGHNGKKEQVNGIGCFAANLVEHLKTPGPGGIYLYPPSANNYYVDYEYEIRYVDKKFTLFIDGEEFNPEEV